MVTALVLANLAVVLARLDSDDSDGLRAAADLSSSAAPVRVGGVELAQADLSAPPVEPHGAYAGGTVVLGGSVPDAATAAGYFGKARSVLGPATWSCR